MSCCDNCEALNAVKYELDSYQKCAESNLQQISALNVKYENTVNELSTIINIFEYINLVTDYKNLFSIINDMLIGVLGATNSTIFVHEDGSYRIEASNLSRQLLKNMDSLGAALYDRYPEHKEASILGEADIVDEFSRSRGIKSAVIVPLIGKSELMGIIYLEHNKEGYFSHEILRYLNTLAIAIKLSLENARLYSKLEEMALIDSLTGLYNRMFFNKEIQNCMENYKKFGLPFILTILDADHFKNVNDTYGHLCGDVVLKEISELTRNSIRKDDVVCRYGGEEFTIIFRNTGDVRSIVSRLEALREAIEAKHVPYQGKSVNVTCSFGVVCCSTLDKNATIEEVVKKADEALYEAKKSGRNRICVAI